MKRMVLNVNEGTCTLHCKDASTPEKFAVEFEEQGIEVDDVEVMMEPDEFGNHIEGIIETDVETFIDELSEIGELMNFRIEVTDE